MKAVTPGPVAGAPLAVVTLQAKLGQTTTTDPSELARTAERSVRLKTEEKTAEGARAGKWLKARKPGSVTATTGTGTTSQTSGGSTTNGVTTTVSGSAGSATLKAAGAAATGTLWPNVGAVLASGQVQEGDHILLMDGYHGSLNLKGYKFSSPVTISSVPGQIAHVDGIDIRTSSNITFDNLKVWARSANAGNGPLIRSYSDTADITFSNLDIRSVANAPNFPSWTLNDWLNNERSGILGDGARVKIIGNRITGLYHGAQLLGPDGLIQDNIIDGFSGDAMRALGNDNTVRHNKAQNCVQIGGNHADGFQSFSRGPTGKSGSGTVYNLTVEGNKIFEWTLSTTNPLRCQLQGIGMFDGMYDGTVIRNNVISSNSYHGIAIAGALNSVIVNNTVVRANGAPGNYPWIRLSPHKNGTKSSNVVAANNTAQSVQVTVNGPRKIAVMNNVAITNANAEFTAPNNRDYTLRAGAKSIDAANPAYAPPTDLTGAPRPKGRGPDAGAYENF